MKYLATLFLLTCSFCGFSHKFFISIADMEYDAEQNRINVSLKLTAHDFESVMKRKYQQKIDLEMVEDTSLVGQYLQEYLFQNFELYSSDKKLRMNYLGKEVNSRDELFLYFFFPDVSNPKAIKIVNRLLFSVSDQQQNIVHYKLGDYTKSVTLVPAKSEEWITFE